MQSYYQKSKWPLQNGQKHHYNTVAIAILQHKEVLGWKEVGKAGEAPRMKWKCPVHSVKFSLCLGLRNSCSEVSSNLGLFCHLQFLGP